MFTHRKDHSLNGSQTILRTDGKVAARDSTIEFEMVRNKTLFYSYSYSYSYLGFTNGEN